MHKYRNIYPGEVPQLAAGGAYAMAYDADGRLTADESRGVTRVVYNPLGLPQRVTMDDGCYVTNDNRARVLDALTGRFTTPDPLAEKYPDQSPYAHCANNPVRFIDPTGRVLEYPSSPSNMSFNYKMRDVRAYVGTDIKEIEEKLRNSPHHFMVFDANREGGGNRIRTILKLFRK